MSPFRFLKLFLIFAFRATGLSVYRLLTLYKSHLTNYVTALKASFLKVFLGSDYTFIYSERKAALRQSRMIKGEGFRAYDVFADRQTKLVSSDIVLLFFHGGGYYFGQALQYPHTFKRWKRISARNGKRMSIVSVEYSELLQELRPL